MSNKLNFFIKYLSNPRLRRDIKSLKLAKKGYVFFAYELIKTVRVYDALKTTNLTVNELSIKLHLKNLKMLETLLDFLVGNKVLAFANGKYYLGKHVPTDFSDNEKKFITTHYNKSQDWTMYLFSFAETALRNNEREELTGFDDDYASVLWDEVMIGPLQSLRNIAISKLLKELPTHSTIVDFGCGSGSSMVEIAQKISTHNNLIGIDISQRMLNIAKDRMSIYCPNYDRYKLIKSDLSEKVDNRLIFEAAFCSLLLNHLSESEREVFVSNVASSMQPGGKFVVFQLVNKSKFDRVFSDWLLFVTPTHKGFPFLHDYLNLFRKNFGKVEVFLDGTIIIATK